MARHIPARKTADEHLDGLDFLIFDVETTGLSPDAGDRVCELGAVRMRGGAVMETFSSLVDPCRPISSGAYAVNKISPEMLQNAPTFTLVAPKLLPMLQDTVIVAYNAPFDISFLANELRLIGNPPLENIVVDALALARQLLPGLGRYPQENVARVLGIPFPVKHRALEDAMVTARLFSIFTSVLKAYDCTRCRDLLRRDLASVMFAKRMNILTEAMSKRSDLWIRYLSPQESAISDRLITPKECVEEPIGHESTSYLIAYCHSSRADRNFRIDRILDLRMIEI